MSHTRAELDRKLTRLRSRAREMSPRAYARRHLPDYMLDRTLGGFLTIVGLRMAWSRYRELHNRRARVRAALASYGRW